MNVKLVFKFIERITLINAISGLCHQVLLYTW